MKESQKNDCTNQKTDNYKAILDGPFKSNEFYLLDTGVKCFYNLTCVEASMKDKPKPDSETK